MKRQGIGRLTGTVMAMAFALTAFPATAQVITEIQKLLPGDGNVADRFGTSVAIDGNTAVIGAPDPLGDSPGAAYVFTFDGEFWTEQQKLVSSDAELRLRRFRGDRWRHDRCRCAS
jgi:hypothetical protein